MQARLYYLLLVLKHMLEGRVSYGLHGGEIPLVYLITGVGRICVGVAGISLRVLRIVVCDHIPCLGGSRRISGDSRGREVSLQLILKHITIN